MKLGKLPVQYLLKYTASSFCSTVAEESVFLLLTWLLHDSVSGFWLVAIPMASGRLVSSFLNFWLNQKLVFRSRRPAGGAMLRYFAQAIPVAILQMVLTYGVYSWCNIGEDQVILRGVIYAGVMTGLSVISFLLQKFWVFSATEKAEKQGEET